MATRKEQELEKAAAAYADLRTQFKKIEAYTDEELDATIKHLGATLPQAYLYLNFIDAYFERRKRRELEANK